MTIDNFEDPPETEGNPPTQWPSYGGYTWDIREIDDAQPHTGALSLWLKARAGGHSFCGWTVPITDKKLRIWVYFRNTTSDFRMISEKSAMGYISANFMVYLFCDTEGNIKYYDSEFVDTNVDYTTGWHYFDIVHDWGADTFDAWYDGVQIVFNGGYYAGQSGGSAVGIAIFMGQGADNELYMDDVDTDLVEGWSGNFNGRLNPPNINGRAKNEVQEANGVPSA